VSGDPTRHGCARIDSDVRQRAPIIRSAAINQWPKITAVIDGARRKSR
jgi:hypothetical protein